MLANFSAKLCSTSQYSYVVTVHTNTDPASRTYNDQSTRLRIKALGYRLSNAHGCTKCNGFHNAAQQASCSGPYSKGLDPRDLKSIPGAPIK